MKRTTSISPIKSHVISSYLYFIEWKEKKLQCVTRSFPFNNKTITFEPEFRLFLCVANVIAYILLFRPGILRESFSTFKSSG